MELAVKGQFLRDLSSYKNKTLLKEVYAVIKQMEAAKDIATIKKLKKLRDYKFFYRIAITGNYRIGLKIQGDKIYLVRFGHRRNFYKEFP